MIFTKHEEILNIHVTICQTCLHHCSCNEVLDKRCIHCFHNRVIRCWWYLHHNRAVQDQHPARRHFGNSTVRPCTRMGNLWSIGNLYGQTWSRALGHNSFDIYPGCDHSFCTFPGDNPPIHCSCSRLMRSQWKIHCRLPLTRLLHTLIGSILSQDQTHTGARWGRSLMKWRWMAHTRVLRAVLFFFSHTRSKMAETRRTWTRYVGVPDAAVWIGSNATSITNWNSCLFTSTPAAIATAKVRIRGRTWTHSYKRAYLYPKSLFETLQCVAKMK